MREQNFVPFRVLKRKLRLFVPAPTIMKPSLLHSKPIEILPFLEEPETKHRQLDAKKGYERLSGQIVDCEPLVEATVAFTFTRHPFTNILYFNNIFEMKTSTESYQD